MVVRKLRRVLGSIMPSDAFEKNETRGRSGRAGEEHSPDAKSAVQPSREKVPEGEGNLRRRADSFQKRTTNQ